MRRYVVRFAVVVGLAVATVHTPVPLAHVAEAGVARPGGGVDDGSSGPPPGAPAPPREAWSWTQLTSRGTEVRHVTPDTSCPSVVYAIGLSVTRSPMVRRSRVDMYPSTATVCTFLLSPAVTGARVDVDPTSGIRFRPRSDGRVPLPNWTQPTAATRRPANIAVIGDSGCRVTSTGPQQDCATGWPFQRVANNAAAQPTPPNLVVHTGDYIYRSDLQRQPAPLCGDPGTSPVNPHTWGCLVTDFFRPAEALLAQAPFVFVRGNHETCGRAGAVWFRYLADSLSTTACNVPEDYSRPVRIAAGTLGLLLFDSSCSSDDATPPTCSRTLIPDPYRAQFNLVNSLARPGDNFLLSHTPLWAVNGRTPNNNPEWIDQRLEDAVTNSSAGMLSQRIRFVLSGHVHLYQMLDFGTSTMPRRPVQVTVGSSGTLLDQQTRQDGDMINKPVDNVPVGHLVTVDEFGYGTLRDTGTTWNLRYFTEFGAVVTRTDCNLTGSQCV